MIQYANLAPSTVIQLSPGDIQTYRLLTMVPGEFHLYSNQLGITPDRVRAPNSPGAGQPMFSATRQRDSRTNRVNRRTRLGGWKYHRC